MVNTISSVENTPIDSRSEDIFLRSAHHELELANLRISQVMVFLTPDCGGAVKLVSSSVSSAMLIKKSPCPSPRATYIIIVSGALIRSRARLRGDHASSALIAVASPAWPTLRLPPSLIASHHSV